MCWNASISINTYIFTTFTSIFAYYNKIIDIYILLFFQSIAAIQLFEYFVWSKTFNNMWLSIAGLLIILSQPIFSILQISIENPYRNLLLTGYLISVLIQYIFITPWKSIEFRTVPAKNGHLEWKWLLDKNFGTIWLIFFFLPFLIDKQYFIFWFGLITCIIFAGLYNTTYTFGSMWCWISNTISFWLIGLVFWKDLSVRFC